jgi:hypothetical protein
MFLSRKLPFRICEDEPVTYSYITNEVLTIGRYAAAEAYSKARERSRCRGLD